MLHAKFQEQWTSDSEKKKLMLFTIYGHAAILVMYTNLFSLLKDSPEKWF